MKALSKLDRLIALLGLFLFLDLGYYAITLKDQKPIAVQPAYHIDYYQPFNALLSKTQEEAVAQSGGLKQP